MIVGELIEPVLYATFYFFRRFFVSHELFLIPLQFLGRLLS